MVAFLRALAYKNIFNNRLLDFLIAIAIFLGIAVAITIVKKLMLGRLKRWAQSTAGDLDDFIIAILEKLFLPFLYCFSLYAGLKYLRLPAAADRLISMAVIGVLTFFVIHLAIRLINYGFTLYWHRTAKTEELEHSLKGILIVIKFLLWSMALVFFLDNLGFKITSVIAGLGIGGVAIALAAQAILADLFSYFSIIFDRPFEIGDFIIIGDLLGTVEHIGIKTTRIRSLGGEQLVFSNSDLTNSRVRNYKRMDKRRVVFSIGVVYQTPLELLKEIPSMIAAAIRKIPDAAFDRAHFFQFSDSSLNYEVVYYVLSSDYNKYMDIQQEINFLIHEAFDRHGIEFAYPTRTVYIAKDSSGLK